MISLPNVGPGRAVLAFDVGGTDIKSALVDERGEVRGVTRSATPVGWLAAPTSGGLGAAPQIVAQLRELQRELTSAHPEVVPVAASIVVPGIVDAERGVGVYSANLGWREAPVRALAEEALGLPVAFNHDIHSASSAELQFGAARGARNALIVVLGTGIAGTVVIDGKPYLAGGFAGEIGHAPVADGPICSCGARSCLEAIASGGAIARRYRDRVRASDDTNATPDRVQEILALAAAGDPRAQAVWNEALDALATSFAQVSALISPDTIVLAGGLSLAGDAILVPLRERLAARLSFHRMPRIVAAELGGDAGLTGAVLFARELAGAEAGRGAGVGHAADRAVATPAALAPQD